MSETIKKQAKHLIMRPLPVVVLLMLSLPTASGPANAEELSDYGARMCADAGIPADECTLADHDGGSETESATGKGGKLATLIGHGQRLCGKEGVAAEDCLALPSSYRRASSTEAGPFLTAPERIPVIDVRTAPATGAAAPPIQDVGRGSGFVDVPPPADPAFRNLGPPVPPGDILVFDAGPPPPAIGPGFRDVGARPPRIDLGFGNVRERDQFVEPGSRDFGPAFVDDGGAVTVVEDDPTSGFAQDGRRERCRRAVQYSDTTSNRFVTC